MESQGWDWSPKTACDWSLEAGIEALRLGLGRGGWVWSLEAGIEALGGGEGGGGGEEG